MELIEKFDIIYIEAIYHPIYLIPRFYIINNLKTIAANQITSDKYQEYYINLYINYYSMINYY